MQSNNYDVKYHTNKYEQISSLHDRRGFYVSAGGGGGNCFPQTFSFNKNIWGRGGC